MTDQVAPTLEQDDSTVRDNLARERTALARERTFLAYLRTALALVAVGATFIQFFGSLSVQVIGWIFIGAGLGTFVVGLLRFKARRARP
ncbi:MAG TPA: DUF202 domain-containing protein [Nitrospiraceae bacterium]|nr:DUF202 domain-containing protein [Nitrospiraceae bacterium]